MKGIVIRDNAFKACEKLHYAGPGLLFAIIREAMTGEKPDFENDDMLIGSVGAEAVYEAIAPEILQSLTDDDDVKNWVLKMAGNDQKTPSFSQVLDHFVKEPRED